MLTFARYMAFQLPGWVLALSLAWLLDAWTDIARHWLVLGVAVFAALDLVLYPFVRSAYEHRPHEPGSELRGMRGRVVVALDPDGWVELGHERWRARRSEPGEALAVGARIRVRALRGQTLLVEADEAGHTGVGQEPTGAR